MGKTNIVAIQIGDLGDIVDECFLAEVDANIIIGVLVTREINSQEVPDLAIEVRSYSGAESGLEELFNGCRLAEIDKVVYIQTEVNGWLALDEGTVK